MDSGDLADVQRPASRVVVAIPGTLCSPETFEPLATVLADTIRIDAIDWMCGDGPWDIPAVARRIEAHIAGFNHGLPVTILGHSTGGAIALQIVTERPDLADSLIIVNSGPNMRGHGDVGRIIAAAEGSWGRLDYERVLTRSLGNVIDADLVDRLFAYAAKVPAKAVVEVLRSQRSSEYDGGLRSLQMRVLVIHGREDPVRTTEQAQAFTRAIPGAKLRVVDGGHTPFVEYPQAAADAIECFLQD
jgi:pimeloyl-ACP methyl ester carboxylesterase